MIIQNIHSMFHMVLPSFERSPTFICKGPFPMGHCSSVVRLMLKVRISTERGAPSVSPTSGRSHGGLMRGIATLKRAFYFSETFVLQFLVYF